MNDDPHDGNLHAQVAALRSLTENELHHINARLTSIDTTQAYLMRTATQGKTGLNVLLWLGGLIGGTSVLISLFWDKIHG